MRYIGDGGPRVARRGLAQHGRLPRPLGLARVRHVGAGTSRTAARCSAASATSTAPAGPASSSAGCWAANTGAMDMRVKPRRPRCSTRSTCCSATRVISLIRPATSFDRGRRPSAKRSPAASCSAARRWSTRPRPTAGVPEVRGRRARQPHRRPGRVRRRAVPPRRKIGEIRGEIDQRRRRAHPRHAQRAHHDRRAVGSARDRLLEVAPTRCATPTTACPPNARLCIRQGRVEFYALRADRRRRGDHRALWRTHQRPTGLPLRRPGCAGWLYGARPG